MTTDQQPTTGTPAGRLRSAITQLTATTETLWAGRTPDELADVVALTETVRSLAEAVRAQAVAEVDARDLAKQWAWGSTASWVTHIAGLRRGHGKRIVDHARHLTGDRTTTLTALTTGAVSPEQAAVVLTAIDELPLAGTHRDQAEELLIAEAAHLDATALAVAGRRVIDTIDPTREERRDQAALDREERLAHHQRGLSITDDGAGGIRLKGRGTHEDGALLRTALLPLTTPTPAPDPGESEGEGEGCEPGRDPRDHGARMWDALVRLAQHSLDTELAPESHGARPRLAITVDLDTLRTGLTTAGILPVTDDGTQLGPAAVRRLACDCDLMPTTLGSHGQVLDAGRTVRLVGGILWRALVTRDRHCAFPSCTRPPVMCHAHHIHHWADGGPTSLTNTVLLCGHHHRTLHHTPWQVRLNPHDQLPEFLPPPKPGHPPPTWIRHRPRRE